MTVKLFEISSQNCIEKKTSASTLDELTTALSDGFYTTFSTVQGGTCVMGLQAHLSRLYKPAHDQHLHPSVDEMTLRRHIAELAASLLPKETRFRLILTKDTGDVYIGFQPLIPTDPLVYKNGVHVITIEMARHDPRIKGTDFITQSAAQRKLIKEGVYEILMAKTGEILEGMTSNFYVVKGQELITAQKGILLGVTRRAVLRLARGEGMKIEYRRPQLVEKFDEAFLTSSSRGVVPIVRIDDKPVGQGKVGSWTKALSLAYQAYVKERSERI